MRSNPAEYELVAPANLSAAVSLLAEEPGAWLPIAGGTDVMVQYAAGKLPARKLVSIWNLPELRRIKGRRTKFISVRDALIPICESTRLCGVNSPFCHVLLRGPAESRTRIAAPWAATSSTHLRPPIPCQRFWHMRPN